jgi:hypothetical protein
MTKQTEIPYRNRIVGQGVKPASEFLANEKNWRGHPKFQQDGLDGVLSSVGWVQTVIENANTGTLIDGHARIVLALRKGDDTPVPYVQVDLTPEEEAVILATFDPISAMAFTDRAKLDELLHQVNSDDERVQQMLASIGGVPADFAAEWQGMPEFGNEPLAERSLYVHFRTNEDFMDFSRLICQDISDKTKSIWYPEKARQDLKSMVFENES